MAHDLLLTARVCAAVVDQAFVSSSNQLDGAEWISVGNPTGSGDSFDSQPALVWPYTSRTTNQSYYVYMGDRWAYPNLLNASYIWLPFTVADDRSLTIQWRDQWLLDDPFRQQQPQQRAEQAQH